MSILSLRSAVTTAGGTPTQYTHVGLLRELITAWGGTPSYWSVTDLLRQAITVKGGTPTKFRFVDLLRDLVTQLGGTPTTFQPDALYAQIAPLSTGSVPVTLSATDKAANITLTNGGLTSYDNALAGPNSVRATRGGSTAKFYYEANIDTAAGNLTLGAADSTQSLTVWWWNQVHAFAFQGDGLLAYNGGGGNVTTAFVTNDKIMIAIDPVGKLAWVGKNGTWINGTPGSSGGLAIAGINTPMLPGLESENGMRVTFNFGATAFTYTPPSGFTAL